VDCAAGGILRDLLAAAEAVGDEDGFGRGGADGGEENPFAERLGDDEFFALEAERAGHAAATGVEEFDFGAGAAEDRDFVGHLHDGFVMAVTLEDDFSADKLGGLEIRDVTGEEFAEEEGLLAEALCARVVGEEVDQFVAEDAGAAGLEEDEGNGGIDLRGELVENFQQILPGLFQKSEVVEWAAAADVVAWDFDGETG
jgi:hypothetical protein